MAGEQPLAGVKILDLMWVLAGPSATRVLADYGATVVRVESTKRLDICRTLRPMLRMQAGAESAVLFHNTNAGKLMLTLDPSKQAGRAVLRDLVAWADVVAEAFAPGAMHAWDLDYESLRAIKPDVIMLSTCLMGQTGPLAAFAGFGNLAAAITGFYDLCGWPDRPPAGAWGAYTDYVAPRFTAAALLAALDHRRRTGEGQHIDLSQAEASLQLLSPALLDYTVNGRVQSRVGNRDRHMSPHGVYPCTGLNRWVAIAVASDEQWARLCAIVGQPELAAEARFATAAARLERADEVDAIVAAWTAEREMHDVEATLQAERIPAAAVQNSPELCADPQLRHRGHFVEIAHPEHGTTTIEGSRFKLSRTPAQLDASAPTFGRDNQHVLETILGYDEERITELVVQGVLE